MDTAENNSSCGIIGGVEEDYDTGNIRAAGGRNFKFWKSKGEWIKTLPENNKQAIEVDYVQGALVMFSSAAIVAGLRFDEKMFMYGDEIDMHFQLKKKGFKAVIDSRCRVRHKSPPQTFSLFQGYFIQRNRIYLSRKHASRLQFIVAVVYTGLLELPVKALVRTLQGHGRYAWACFLGFVDGLTNRMSVGRAFQL